MFSKNKSLNSHGNKSLHKKIKNSYLRTRILVLRPEKTLPKATHGVFYCMAVKPGP